MTQLSPPQIGAAQIAAGQVGSSQIALFQVLSRKIGARKVGTLAARLPFVKFLVRFQDVAEFFAFVSNGSRLSGLGQLTSGCFVQL